MTMTTMTRGQEKDDNDDAEEEKTMMMMGEREVKEEDDDENAVSNRWTQPPFSDGTSECLVE